MKAEPIYPAERQAPMVMRARGGQAHYVIGRDGRPIVGLSRNGHDGRFYATHSKPRKWFGGDYDRALILYHEWKAAQHGEKVTISEPRPPSPSDWDAVGEYLLSLHPGGPPPRPMPDWLARIDADLKAGRPPTWAVIQEHVIASDVFWSAVRNAITADPALAEQKTGLPLSRLWQYKPVGPSPTLESLAKEYETHATVTPDTRRCMGRYWAEFAQMVGVRTIGEITQAAVTAYADEIKARCGSHAYMNHRFGTVKTIFAFARKRGIAPSEIRTVLDYCAVLTLPRKSAKNPQPISREDFHTLLNAASPTWQAILLCALNFCMYGGEVTALEWTDLDLDKRTLVTDRHKTGVTRVAVLWDRTVEALKALPRKHPRFVVITQQGGPYRPGAARSCFQILRRRSGIPHTVKFNMIRDGAYSAAVEYAPVTEGRAVSTNAMLLAGHATGMPDHYVKRNPRMVADACAAVERAYFG